MKPRFILSPEAAQDLASIWDYIKEQSSGEMADHVESVIRDRILLLARSPRAGHYRKDITDLEVGSFPCTLTWLFTVRSEAAASSCCSAWSTRCGNSPAETSLLN